VQLFVFPPVAWRNQATVVVPTYVQDGGRRVTALSVCGSPFPIGLLARTAMLVVNKLAQHSPPGYLMRENATLLPVFGMWYQRTRVL
jgi:hypothetical protein